jgi:hypothetical protein
MRTATKLLVIGSAIGAAMILRKRRAMRRKPEAAGVDALGDRPRSPTFAEAGDVGSTGDRETDEGSPPMGISDVDPQPVTQISGEGIDPDATRVAHEDLPDQRERLPIPGKNLV